jgi:aspartate racemase
LNFPTLDKRFSNTKKLGIIGGMGSRAGAVLFNKILDYCPAVTDQDFPEIILHNNSHVPDRTKAIIYGEPSPVHQLQNSFKLFEQNNVDIIALACVTSYFYVEEFMKQTSAQILNPLDLVSEHIRSNHPRASRVGLLATSGTIRTGLFHKALGNNVEIVTLNELEQEEIFMKSVYMPAGFKSAKVSVAARELMMESVNKLVERNVDLIVGGCTEVSIGVNQQSLLLPYIDTTDILAKKSVECCYSQSIQPSVA